MSGGRMPERPRTLLRDGFARARWLHSVCLWLALLLPIAAAQAEDGYDLWLRYQPLAETQAAPWRAAATHLVASAETPMQQAARDELRRGLGGLLGAEPPLAATADGLTGDVEGEEMKVNYPGFAGGDRTDLRLPKPQRELLEALHGTGKPVVAVLTTGSALAIDWAQQHVPAILLAWYPGQRGGSAVADVLFGDANPGGRLPVTFYKESETLPAFDDYAMRGRTYRYFAGTAVPVRARPVLYAVRVFRPAPGPQQAGRRRQPARDAEGPPAFERAGVTLSDDIAGYERAKLRLLNGPHFALAYLGSLLGLEKTVADAMRHPQLAAFVETLMRENIAPTLQPMPGFDPQHYTGAILARFRDSAIGHRLAQIAWDGSQKLPVRLLGTIADALAAGRRIDRLCLPIAAWMQFVRRQARDGVALVDPMGELLSEIGRGATADAGHDVDAFLALDAVFASLSGDVRFVKALRSAYAVLGECGAMDIERSLSAI